MRVRDSFAAMFDSWARVAHSLSGKLVILLVASMTLVFGTLGYLNVKLQRQRLEESTLASAERISDVIKRNASYYMLRNERDGLYHMITDIGNEPGMVRIRIFNREGQISFSSDSKEINSLVDKRAEACYACHSQSQPLTHLTRPDRFRTYTLPDGKRALGIINPIENSPGCYTASCHAHPPSQAILGVLDTNLSLASADANVAQSTRRTVLYTIAAVVVICLLSVLFVWRVVHGPLRALEAGTQRLASGDLGYQIDVRSRDELADLAVSFNSMSRQLREAREEITSWNRKLENRVREKTEELNQAHEQMLRAERMASIGKLAAVVAHEINNPLAGILTYAKLLKKRFASCSDRAEDDAISSLSLIESESRRCGEIVKNLMSFARATPLTFEPSDLNAVIRRCVQLVQHQLTLANIESNVNLAADLPAVSCDPSQIEQVILSLVMNAIDAMPHGGTLAIASHSAADSESVKIQVQDDGIGIFPDVLPNLFEPFFTTKERGHGLGLGLAISRTIIERHLGRINVVSEPGRGSVFTITLPVGGKGARRQSAPQVSAQTRE
ncbi:MAG TPA: ATP-binding protein [Candidatus Limnocylindrales bacterium]|nr:ATP-binding protein [Candidatus Limnocylindrales bacterium]